ncbi:MAG: tripartite tricarboxylate transporter substrate binding protein [Ottowia sp.]|uniref:Bug family tripartite tricarboxylate transporter substrate binding protein n=1 Tax=Ottowia sp. TaxID=1898956 RepID=UPI0039E558AC
MLKKRTALGLMAAGAGALAGLPLRSALAQAAAPYPSKALRWLVPYPAGGGSDFLARVAGLAMAADLKQPVVVDNKPGGNGAIAVADVKRSPADGYTLINIDNGIMVFNSVLYQNLGYSPEKDLQLVTLLAKGPMFLAVGPASTARDAREFIAQVRAQPGKLSFASAGAGTPQHLAMELLMKRAGLSMVHIPYKGSSPALADLVGGQVPVAITDYAAARGFFQAGKLRPLAITDAQRHPSLPDVPTFKEVGIEGMEFATMVGVAVRAGTPMEHVRALQQAVRRAIHSPEVRTKYGEFGIVPDGNTPEEFQALIGGEIKRWHPLVKELGIRLDG